ncbi:GNAT family N-acetyltransferase [Paraburkholderia terricola]|uniref:GNAT family N-acetyltransferase n=1 Tax=Paraburkholderia terricola TaxID=169427 RepID=UPI001374F99A|nr:GNAT family N-acetyltransferase [Paraburkholderia terricola]
MMQAFFADVRAPAKRTFPAHCRDRTGFQLEIITNPVRFRALQQEWNDLWSKEEGRYGQAFAACWQCWLCVAQPRGRKLCCITLREQGRLVLVWPLVTYRKLFWTVVRPLASESTDYTNILVQGGASAPALIERAWHAVERLSGADVILLPFTSADSGLYELASGKRHVMVKTAHPLAVAKLRCEKDWETYSASLGRLFRNRPGSLERRLSTMGAMQIRILGPENKDENARLVDWMLSCKRQWAARTGKKGGWLYSREYRDYLVALLNQTDDGIIARLLVLSLDGEPIAVNIFGVGKNCLDDLIAGFEPAYARQTPGAIATEHCVRWALEHNLDMDLGAGTEKYKGYWSRQHISTVWSLQIANTLWGLLGFHADNLRQRVRWRLPVGAEGLCHESSTSRATG